MAAHAAMKLGRHRPTLEQRRKVIPLMQYLTQPLPPAPLHLPWCNAPIGMFGNDRYGCCTIAGLGNTEAIDSHHEGRACEATEEGVVASYLKFTGGADDGAVETDVLGKAAAEGFELGGEEPWRLAVYASIPVRNIEAIKSCMAIFWSVYLGVSLPESAQAQDVWGEGPTDGLATAPGSWGGHALLAASYDEHGRFGLITWGEVKQATTAWLKAYCDEVYVLLDAKRAEAVGVDWGAIMIDIAAAQALR